VGGHGEARSNLSQHRDKYAEQHGYGVVASYIRQERSLAQRQRRALLPKPPLASRRQSFLINGGTTIARDDTTLGGNTLAQRAIAF
jgi:hypothetical protein